MSNIKLIEVQDSGISENSPFFLNEQTSAKAKIFRLMAGGCSLKSQWNDEDYELNRNYFLSSDENLGISFLDYYENDLNLEDYSSYLNQTKFFNKKFYTRLFDELANAVYAEKKEQHSKAFIFIYRAYECLSYAFPMIYAARTEDFIGTYSDLQSWLTPEGKEKNVGELRFHRKFLEKIYKDQAEVSLFLDINITGEDYEKEKIFDVLTKKVMGWKNEDQYSQGTVKFNKVSIGFLEFHTFIVHLRNRFFHYSNGNQSNITAADILDSDYFFSLVNERCLHYISKIFHTVVVLTMPVRESAEMDG